ncbi:MULTISPECIES: hydrogen peroxide-inducible genes activator [unclassified Aureispira]|uniref:hydrogen peroxide-inducible genes activator n=1 Tax=unclassified Aureispira TaxID=2649989 RepID=UPI0006963C6D|nr:MULTISPECIES: hydrogen peroxide-inducible genes activator [unclassified Aureispira]WMX16495.1 LysR substrate-binding domain-containing protein [Aureispira sp. CCB-E]
MPTITQLEYIVAVDRERHFGLAAKKCFVTQPTLSAQIKKAEELLGVLIFDRSKQPILPTDIGEKIIQQARVVLREHQRLEQIIADFQNDISGQLRIGVLPTIAPYLLPFFVGNFTRKYPKINLLIKERTSKQIIEDLQNDLLDVGLMITPLKEDAIKERPLFYEEIQLYVHPEHHFSKNGRIAPSLLNKGNMWMLSQGHCFRNQVVNLCALQQQGGFNNNLPFQYEGGSLEALQRLVDKEGGFTLLPELATLNSGQNVRSLQAPVPLREVSLVYIRNYAKIKLLELLEQQIIATIPTHMLSKNRGQIIDWK